MEAERDGFWFICALAVAVPLPLVGRGQGWGGCWFLFVVSPRGCPPPPLWGGGRGGGVMQLRRTPPPPSPTLPHKGGGSLLRLVATAFVFRKRGQIDGRPARFPHAQSGHARRGAGRARRQSGQHAARRRHRSGREYPPRHRGAAGAD